LPADAVPTVGGRVVALDLGSTRIGVAVSDSAGTLASPRPALVRSDRAADHRAVVELVEETGARAVVVGLPRSLDGRLGPAARGALEEVHELEQVFEGTGVTVETIDERFTTVTASTRLAEAGRRGPSARAVIDSAAAAVLLQAWLERR
jgi:putative Holliday junction resolvase